MPAKYGVFTEWIDTVATGNGALSVLLKKGDR
jgi:hypothetical protein